jgi:transposase
MKVIPHILEDADNKLTSLLRELLNELYDEMVYLDERISSLENKKKQSAIKMKIANAFSPF